MSTQPLPHQRHTSDQCRLVNPNKQKPIHPVSTQRLSKWIKMTLPASALIPLNFRVIVLDTLPPRQHIKP
ncbi:hypothetical protein NQ317_006356 [Molorchus minor]|uniref:Uncharacterized protein n=1 Tax=Molorchus minor TaxID=1323400 RepID=A0ABQ9JNK7_9CUCU|nr:hypothetical protein NQ317_006356 [Molorchus minor]